jgi:hypothetical protein
MLWPTVSPQKLPAAAVPPFWACASLCNSCIHNHATPRIGLRSAHGQDFKLHVVLHEHVWGGVSADCGRRGVCMCVRVCICLYGCTCVCILTLPPRVRPALSLEMKIAGNPYTSSTTRLKPISCSHLYPQNLKPPTCNPTPQPQNSRPLTLDFMFSKPELLWLRSSWKASTGRELKHPTLDCEQILAQIQAGVYIKKSPAP